MTTFPLIRGKRRSITGAIHVNVAAPPASRREVTESVITRIGAIHGSGGVTRPAHVRIAPVAAVGFGGHVAIVARAVGNYLARFDLDVARAELEIEDRLRVVAELLAPLIERLHDVEIERVRPVPV